MSGGTAILKADEVAELAVTSGSGWVIEYLSSYGGRD